MISSSVFIILKSVSELVLLSLEVVICEVTGIVAITILNKKYLKLIVSYVQNNIMLKVSLITYHKHLNNTNVVCILVWHFVLFTMEYRMVSGMAIFIVYKLILTKKIIGGPTFHSSIMPFIPGSILRGDSPLIVVSPYP